jgi:hypothetical protein
MSTSTQSEPAPADRPHLLVDPVAASDLGNGNAGADAVLILGCPVCGRVVPTTLAAILARRAIICPIGHDLCLRDCAGLDQAIDFLVDLIRVARRCPP